MQLRTYRTDDLDAVLELLNVTFEPFMDAYRAHVGDVVFTLERDDWRGTYARQVPTLHDPAAGRQAVLAEDDDGLAGYLAWGFDAGQRHGELELLGVAPGRRGKRVATTLCDHAMTDLRSRGAVTVEVGTGGDAFHAPARALYESLGFVAVPVVHYVREL